MIGNKQKVYNAFMKCPRGSDRQVAKIAGVSQPTVTRIREKIEQEGLLDFQCVPNFAKLGLPLMAFIEISNTRADVPDAKTFLLNNAAVLMVAKAIDFHTLITIHKDYSSYCQFINSLKPYMPVFGKITLIDTTTGIVKGFCTKGLTAPETI
jgi:DNA-binding Lrp family transcriptional regulator